MWVSAMLLGCGSPADDRTLVLDGPAAVRVEQFGPVPAPATRLSDGSAPEAVTWTAAPATVAVVHDGVIEAVGPGDATITGDWRGHTATWTLTVAPAVSLVFQGVPERLLVGESTQVTLRQRVVDGFVPPAATVTWSASNPALATVASDGTVTGVAPGVVYVTATAGGSDAVVEIEIVLP